jgi:hypothetical protein
MKDSSVVGGRLQEWILFVGAGVVVGALFNMALGGKAWQPGGLLGGLLSGALVRFLA